MTSSANKPHAMSARQLLAVTRKEREPAALSRGHGLEPGRLARLLAAEGLGGLALKAHPKEHAWLDEDWEWLWSAQRDLELLEELREWAVATLFESLALETETVALGVEGGGEAGEGGETGEDAKISVLALKGFDSARRLYTSKTLRPAGDVDLLLVCTKEQWTQLDFAALKKAGFRELYAPGVITPKDGWNTRTFKQGKLSLDLHHQLFRGPPYRFPVPDLLERSVQLSAGDVEASGESGESGEQGGALRSSSKALKQALHCSARSPQLAQLRALDPLDALCFHVAHLAKHGFRGPLIRWVDLKLMLDSWLEPDGERSWGELEERAKEQGVSRVLRLALAGLEALGFEVRWGNGGGVARTRVLGRGECSLEPGRVDRLVLSLLFDTAAIPSHISPLRNQAIIRLLLVDSVAQSWASMRLGGEWVGRKLRERVRRALG